MVRIQSDQELRTALNALSAEQQRQLGGHFARGVVRFLKDERVGRAIETALRPDASDAELEDAFKAARSYATKTYTACGKDTEWLAQADHFVAAAVAAALTPPGQGSDRQNKAWKAAVQARMAVDCALMEVDDLAGGESEAHRQYAIANAFLG